MLASNGYLDSEGKLVLALGLVEVVDLVLERHELGFHIGILDEEILERCVYPMINEGAKILEEGKAIRASDIDTVWINGYGWPVYRGGPMFYGDTVGLDKVLAKMKQFQAEMGDDFKPSALLEKLVAEGKGFKDL